MSSRAYFYVEQARTGHDHDGELLRGWLASETLLDAAIVELPNGHGFHPLQLGYVRDDVIRSVPGLSADGAHTFLARLPVLGVSPRYARLWVHVAANAAGEKQGNGGSWHVVNVDLTALVENRFNLGWTTRALFTPEEITGVARRSNDVDARFQTALHGARGLTLRLDLINKCNLRCVMCHYSRDEVARRPSKSVTLDDFKRTFASIGPYVRDVVLSCSDEPLLAKSFGDVVRYLAHEHPECRVMFCTNATLLNRNSRKAILETGVERVLLSVDGVTKEMFESIRVGAPFEKVIGNIKALTELKRRHQLPKPDTVLDFVMMKRNLHHAPVMVHAAKLMGVETIDFRHVVMGDTATDIADESLTRHAARFNHYREQVLTAAERVGIRVYIPDPIPTTTGFDPAAEPPLPPLDEVAAIPASLESDEGITGQPIRASAFDPNAPSLSNTFTKTFCPRPFSEVMIRNQDEVLPCPWHTEVMGRLSEGKDLLQIFQGAKFQKLRGDMLRPEGAPGCRHCPLKQDLLPQTLREFAS